MKTPNNWRVSGLGALLAIPLCVGCGGEGEAHAGKGEGLGGFISGLMGGGDDAEDELRAYVRLEPVLHGELMRTLEVSGTVQAGHAVDLVPDIPGKVERLPVKVGQRVAQGDLLARLDVDVAALQRDQAAAAVALAELGAETAERGYARASTLHQQQSLTQEQFEQAQAGLQMAQLQVKQARAALGLARQQVDGGVLRAPFAGVVSSIACEEGEYFNPMTISPMGGPQGLVGLVDLDSIKIDLQVADRDVARLSAGMEARIFVDALAERLPAAGVVGSVESVGLAADPVSRTFPVRVVADNPDHLVLAGTHARVRLVLDGRSETMAVAEAAVREVEGQAYVMVVEGERARTRPVELGLHGDDGVEVLSGLSGNEQVVVEGNFGLEDGALVEVSR